MSGQAPRIFISHDHRDKNLADRFSKLLTSVSGGILRPFQSSDQTGRSGIPSGELYFGYILGEIDKSSAVVCLLTVNSFNRPWILYEAGFAKGKGKRVHGLAIGLDVDQLTGSPFTNFQNLALDEESLTGLLIGLLSLIEEAQPDRETIRGQARAFVLELNAVPKPSKPKRTMEQLLEDVELLLNSKTMQTTYVGQYPEFFEKGVCELLETARQSIQIACDYPAYGFVTDNNLYSRYNNLLIKKSQDFQNASVPDAERKTVISATVLSESVRDDIIKNPFPDDVTKWLELMSNAKYKQGLRALETRSGRKIRGPEDFYRDLRELNQDELKKLEAMGFTCYQVNRRMPIFAWIVDGQKAAFAIPTYAGDSSEHAFSTSDAALIEALQGILVGYREDAKRV